MREGAPTDLLHFPSLLAMRRLHLSQASAEASLRQQPGKLLEGDTGSGPPLNVRHAADNLSQATHRPFINHGGKCCSNLAAQ